MLKRTLLFCILLLLMAHVVLFEECYHSSNWRLRSLVERPQVVNGHKIGVFTIKKGKQLLSLPPEHDLLTMHPEGHEYNLLYCQHCCSPLHGTAYCPLLECHRCHEFGHASLVCKKTLNV